MKHRLRKRISTGLIFILLLFFFSSTFSQQHDLLFYQSQAHTNDPTLKENSNQQLSNSLQNSLILAQFRKPQVFFTSDYLFAPYFNNNNKLIDITNNPDKSAYGYDVGLTNGGLYSSQLNGTLPLLSGGLIKIYQKQNQVQNKILQNNYNQLLHILDKNIIDQYISAYQIQLQTEYQKKLISLVEERLKVVESLVLKAILQQSDYLLLDIELKQRQYEFEQLRLNLYDAFSLLNNTCGINDTSIYELMPPIILESEQLTQFNYQQKFELDSLNIIAQQQIINTKYRPQLALFGNTGINATETKNMIHNSGISAGIHLAIPIYDGKQNKVVFQQNKILLDNINNYKNQVSISNQNNLNSLKQKIIINKQSIDLINTQLKSQEILLQLLKNKIIDGQISITDYLNSVQDYAIAYHNKIITQSNIWLLINQYNFINW